MNRKVWLGGTLLLAGIGAAVTWAARRHPASKEATTDIPARTRSNSVPTAPEITLIQRVKAEGWPVSDPETEFGVEDGRPHITVPTEYGVAKLTESDDKASFRVVSYFTDRGGRLRTGDGLPAEISQVGLHYATFLRLTKKYSLDDTTGES